MVLLRVFICLVYFFKDVVALETLPVLSYEIEDLGKVCMFL